LANLPFELNDYTLLKFLINDYNNIPFISEYTKKHYLSKIKKITKTLEKSDKEALINDGFKIIFNPSREEGVDVLEFWERLLIDSIKYLKWHDGTEFSGSTAVSQGKAYDKISQGSLGIYNLKEYFETFIEFERLLYGAEQFYRDHVYHILKVWLIGHYIIRTYIGTKMPIAIEPESKYTLVGNKFSKSNKNKTILYDGEEDAIWCIIALTHDLGYPLSKVENINTSLRKMMKYYAKSGLEEFSFTFPQQNQFINDSILKYMSSKIIKGVKKGRFETHIQAKYYLKFSRSFELFDHGLISCIVLVKNLFYFLETNFDHNPSASLNSKEEARQFVIRREILRAIASHTCPEIYHFKPNTFSFILLLADEMQSWGRPTFEDMALGAEKRFIVKLNKFSPQRVSFQIEAQGQDNLKPISLSRYFMKKAEIFKKLLRVAVDSNQRKFKLDFTLIDEMGDEYIFIAKKNERALMMLNNEQIDHDELRRFDGIAKKDIKGAKEDMKFLIKYIDNRNK
jgi:hypothetical protein